MRSPDDPKPPWAADTQPIQPHPQPSAKEDTVRDVLERARGQGAQRTLPDEPPSRGGDRYR